MKISGTKLPSSSRKWKDRNIKRELKLWIWCKVQRLNAFCFSQLFAGEAAAIVAPARWAKDILPLLLPAYIFPDNVLTDGLPFVKDDIHGSGLFDGLGQTVPGGLVSLGGKLGLKGAEKLVPDDQEHAHVLIQVARVGGVV